MTLGYAVTSDYVEIVLWRVGEGVHPFSEEASEGELVVVTVSVGAGDAVGF